MVSTQHANESVAVNKDLKVWFAWHVLSELKGLLLPHKHVAEMVYLFRSCLMYSFTVTITVMPF